MALITSSEYPAIRAAIDVKLNENDLRNEMIALDIYSGAAHRDVIARYAEAESETGDDLQRMKNAAIYFCAARLVAVVFKATSVNVTAGDMSWSRRGLDPEQRAEELRAMANEEIDAVLSPTDVTPGKMTMFKRVPGNRGR